MPAPQSSHAVAAFTLKAIAEADLDQVVALDESALGGLWTRDGYRREIDSDASILLGLWAGPRLVGLGCAWFIVDEAHITAIAIEPQFHRQGLGQLMLWALLRISHGRGMKRATLDVNCSNHGAIALYQKFGFQEVGIRKKYYPNGDPAAILWLNRLDWPQFRETLQTWKTQVSDRLGKTPWHWADVDFEPI